MRRLIGRTLSLMVVSLCVGSVAAQERTAGELRSLQGTWTVVAAEHEGQPLDQIKGGTLTITGQGFALHTASGKDFKGQLRLDPTKAPKLIDFVHEEGDLKGKTWEAIYSVDGDDFKLNYIEAGGKDKRPATFTTSKETEASLVLMKRKRK